MEGDQPAGAALKRVRIPRVEPPPVTVTQPPIQYQPHPGPIPAPVRLGEQDFTVPVQHPFPDITAGYYQDTFQQPVPFIPLEPPPPPPQPFLLSNPQPPSYPVEMVYRGTKGGGHQGGKGDPGASNKGGGKGGKNQEPRYSASEWEGWQSGPSAQPYHSATAYGSAQATGGKGHATGKRAHTEPSTQAAKKIKGKQAAGGSAAADEPKPPKGGTFSRLDPDKAKIITRFRHGGQAVVVRHNPCTNLSFK